MGQSAPHQGGDTPSATGRQNPGAHQTKAREYLTPHLLLHRIVNRAIYSRAAVRGSSANSIPHHNGTQISRGRGQQPNTTTGAIFSHHHLQQILRIADTDLRCPKRNDVCHTLCRLPSRNITDTKLHTVNPLQTNLFATGSTWNHTENWPHERHPFCVVYTKRREENSREKREEGNLERDEEWK